MSECLSKRVIKVEGTYWVYSTL